MSSLWSSFGFGSSKPTTAPAGVQQYVSGQGPPVSPLDAAAVKYGVAKPTSSQSASTSPAVAAAATTSGSDTSGRPPPPASKRPAASQPVYVPVNVPGVSGAAPLEVRPDMAGFNFEGGSVGGGQEMVKNEQGFYQKKGKKKALLIGISYPTSPRPLGGCLNDVANVKKWLDANYKFDEILILQDGPGNTDPNTQPTKVNIIAGMKWLVKDAKRGDSLFFHYSGHGGSVKDKSGDEVDGFDETIIPVDYLQSGQIIDDDMFTIMVAPLPEGCHLTALFDSCHSGSILDLPYIYLTDGKLNLVQVDARLPDSRGLLTRGGLDDEILPIEQLFGTTTSRAGDTAAAAAPMAPPKTESADMGLSAEQVKKLWEARKSEGTVVQFAGCADRQTSADATIGGTKTGAASYAFMQVMTKFKTPTYMTLLAGMRQILRDNYSQVVQMSTSLPMNMDQPYVL